MTISLSKLESLAKSASDYPNWDHSIFIAACSPDTILKLIAVARAAKNCRLRFEGGYEFSSELQEALKEVSE
jgi:hypothetical protein